MNDALIAEIITNLITNAPDNAGQFDDLEKGQIMNEKATIDIDHAKFNQEPTIYHINRAWSQLKIEGLTATPPCHSGVTACKLKAHLMTSVQTRPS